MSVVEHMSDSIDERFRHEAFFFSGRDEFTTVACEFIREGIAAGDEVLVIVTAERTGWLREALGPDADHVIFGVMEELGRNPARIIPAWQDFVAKNHSAGRTIRGIGEPVWAGRTQDELVECQRHEALLNVAFDDGPQWRLLCPYDLDALDPLVIAEAERAHPILIDVRGFRMSDGYSALEHATRPFDAPLQEPRVVPVERDLRDVPLPEVRRFVAREAAELGITAERIDDFVLAVNEVVSNSLRHGGGAGTIRMWSDGPSVICEVRDGGRIDDALVGRRRPSIEQESGVGLWLVHQLCDLAQVRTYESGTVVRLHMLRR